jgi:pimeloyl-ACP methyl ester carboxylesterase
METIGRAHETPAKGTSMAWGEMGTGEPLVLLHGMWDSHRTWRRAAPLLAERFRVLMPDLPGHGLSGRPDAPYTLTWYAQTLLAWMDAIGVTHASTSIKAVARTTAVGSQQLRAYRQMRRGGGV